MSLQYKIDVLKELKNKGFTTYRLRNEKVIGEAMMQKLRHGEMVSWATINTLCTLLQCQVGDIVEFIPEKEG